MKVRFVILRDDGFKRTKSGKFRLANRFYPGMQGPVSFSQSSKNSSGKAAEEDVNFVLDLNYNLV